MSIAIAPSYHRLAARSLLLATLSLLPAVAAAQSPPTDAPRHKVGDACVRQSDKKQGVVKRDACGRGYCALIGTKDVIEVRPNVAKEIGCKWRVQFSKQGSICHCVRT